MRLSERVAVVTNGASDLGRSIAIRCAEEGASVIIADGDPAAGGEVLDYIEAAGGEATYVSVDLADEDAVQTVVGDAIMTYGALHHVVACAGDAPRQTSACTTCRRRDGRAGSPRRSRA